MRLVRPFVKAEVPKTTPSIPRTAASTKLARRSHPSPRSNPHFNPNDSAKAFLPEPTLEDISLLRSVS
jgi:hypothetical protein